MLYASVLCLQYTLRHSSYRQQQQHSTTPQPMREPSTNNQQSPRARSTKSMNCTRVRIRVVRRLSHLRAYYVERWRPVFSCCFFAGSFHSGCIGFVAVVFVIRVFFCVRSFICCGLFKCGNCFCECMRMLISPFPSITSCEYETNSFCKTNIGSFLSYLYILSQSFSGRYD